MFREPSTSRRGLVSTMRGSEYDGTIGGIVLDDSAGTDEEIGIEEEEDTSHSIFNNPCGKTTVEEYVERGGG